MNQKSRDIPKLIFRRFFLTLFSHNTESFESSIKQILKADINHLTEKNLVDKNKISVDGQKYLVYEYLRRKYNYCVVDGESLGVDFTLYEGAQTDYHAKYGVIIETEQSKIEDWYEIIMSLRNLGQVKKKLRGSVCKFLFFKKRLKKKKFSGDLC